ncbi:MAG: nucleotidyltransferase domain-containing protein [Myxococcota bacterium]
MLVDGKPASHYRGGVNQASSPAIAQYLSELAQQTRALVGDRLRFVRLFGSWARGEATENSDIDIAVVIDGLSREEWRQVLEVAEGISARLDLYVSPFVEAARAIHTTATQE